MTQLPEALRLADLQDVGYFKEWRNTANELRRLHAENARMASELARPMTSEATLVMHDNTRLRAEIDYEEQRFAALSDDYAKLANVNAQLLEVLKEIMSWEENETMTWAKKARAAIKAAAKETQ